MVQFKLSRKATLTVDRMPTERDTTGFVAIISFPNDWTVIFRDFDPVAAIRKAMKIEHFPDDEIEAIVEEFEMQVIP